MAVSSLLICKSIGCPFTSPADYLYIYCNKVGSFGITLLKHYTAAKEFASNY
jgi:hypothetical protein